MNPGGERKPAIVTADELEKLLLSRIKRIFEIAAANGSDVLILGAFGCGAFINPPKLVASVFFEVMQDYLYHFEAIEYAVYHTDRDDANFEAFREAMKEV